MSKKMLINAMHPEEARVAIVEEGHLVELDVEIEGSEQTRGNIYKGVVVRVEPGLQAAFVDIGRKKLGFIQMGELHPDYWQWRDDIPEEQKRSRPRIQEVLRRGQEIIVQVEKGERDMKGAALTTFISLPGRYMVIMPGSDSAGVSRKVENDTERKKLKEMAAELDIPEGIGYIMRTEALGRKKPELAMDIDYLIRLHNEIQDQGAKVKAPALIYQESNLVIRTIRDYFTSEIDEVLVDNAEVYKQVRDFFKKNMPKHENLVKLHQEKRPIFSKYQLEEQIDQIYEKKVLLKSGGSIVIEPTEALVSIDVNSGKSTGERGVEETAFKTNIEAAEESARQLRLRDLGGLIVIDFIDMRDKKHMTEVEKALKNALKADKARVSVGKISQFGMLEMSRQRIKQTLEHASYLECPHCGGRGKVKSVENMALSFLRKVHAAAAKGTNADVHGDLPLDVAYYLLNRKKRELARIETDYDIDVTIKGKPSFLMNQIDLVVLKRERSHQPELPAVDEDWSAEKPGGGEEVTRPGAGTEGKGKKPRGVNKKPRSAEPIIQPEAAEVEDEGAEAGIAEETLSVDTNVTGAEGVSDGARKKRRRRRRRGGKGHAAEGANTEDTDGVNPPEPEETQAPLPALLPANGEEPPHEGKKKRRRKRRRGSKVETSELSAGQPPVESVDQEAAAVEPPTAVADKKPRKPRVSRKQKTVEAKPVTASEQEHVVVTASEESMPTAPKKRAIRKKAVVDASDETTLPVKEPKPKRAPRKKKGQDSTE
ncbi:MAG: Rne/Rng family ribonuclease [Geobacteraceae bacterium]